MSVPGSLNQQAVIAVLLINKVAQAHGFRPDQQVGKSLQPKAHRRNRHHIGRPAVIGCHGFASEYEPAAVVLQDDWYPLVRESNNIRPAIEVDVDGLGLPKGGRIGHSSFKLRLLSPGTGMAAIEKQKRRLTCPDQEEIGAMIAILVEDVRSV